MSFNRRREKNKEKRIKMQRIVEAHGSASTFQLDILCVRRTAVRLNKNGGVIELTRRNHNLVIPTEEGSPQEARQRLADFCVELLAGIPRSSE